MSVTQRLARLEKENAELKAENKRLKQTIGKDKPAPKRPAKGPVPSGDVGKPKSDTE